VTLEVRNLNKSFKGLVAINDLSFELVQEEILGIMGPNGAGKTTIINLVTGLHKPNSGEVLWQDMDMTRLKPFQIVRMGIARTFQQARVFQNMSVEDNLLVGLVDSRRSNLLSDSSPMVRVKKIMEFVEMEVSPYAFAKDLSQDDLRRLEIARALSSDPKVLILDEPVSGLTPEECDSIINIIRKLKAMGIALVIVEHVMRMLMQVSDRLLVMSSGQKLFEGSPEEVSRNPGH